ncbi:cytochrome P450 [Longispora albida]|uniref:cytochrome P450 n=1 Tax=Longispora albida TaxID=203523 RepID=UPI00035DAFCC|nr:cytochrome P450 [Longispora albida]
MDTADSASDAIAALAALRDRSGCPDPNPLYQVLHQHGEVLELAADRQYSAVAVSYHACNQVLRDPVFQVVDAALMDRGSTRWRSSATLNAFMGSMLFSNGQDHSRVRRLFGQAFTPRRMAALEPAIAAITARHLDKLAELGADGAPVDFMLEFAFRVPSDVMGELVGLPEADREWYYPRALAIHGALELGGTGDPDVMRRADEATTELTGYFTDLVKERRAHPCDDLISSVIEAGEGLISEAELMANLVVLFNAGFVTTTHLLGNGLGQLFKEPQHLARLRAHPKLAPAYVEEFLRFEPSIHFVARWAAEEAEVAGVRVPKGGGVLVLLGAGNRDPRKYEHPDLFDPDRTAAQPLSFSGGAHYCLGAALTRIEAGIVVPMLLERFPAIAPAVPLAGRTHLALRGYPALPVTLA